MIFFLTKIRSEVQLSEKVWMTNRGYNVKRAVLFDLCCCSVILTTSMTELSYSATLLMQWFHSTDKDSTAYMLFFSHLLLFLYYYPPTVTAVGRVLFWGRGSVRLLVRPSLKMVRCNSRKDQNVPQLLVCC